MTHIGNILSATALLALSLSSVAQAADPTFSFGLWGDMPYAKAKDDPKIPALIADINASDIAFSVFDGDIKDGSSKCTDDQYEAAIARFNTFNAPVVYLPGDNEWTDCHRVNNGGYDAVERLDHVRKVMLAKPESFGMTTITPEHQGNPGEKFSENVRIAKDGIVVVGLNIPGSNNNKVHEGDECVNKKTARTAEQCATANAEYAERDTANIAWMHESFAAATAAKAAGIMIVFQGDPGFDYPETEDIDESRLPNKDGYAAFLDKLMEETKAFAGQVVIVHGDTHFFKIDKPLSSATTLVPNLTRIQTFGSPNIHWIKVNVDTSSRDVFTFHPMIVPGN